jgi:cold shock CspA family protein
VQVTFRDVTAPPQAEQWIHEEAAKLGAFYRRILGCHVAVESPHRRRGGGPYHVRIDLTVPGGELVIKHEPTLQTQARQVGESAIRKHLEARKLHKHLRQAINDAFKTAGRRLQDYARRQRGDVKHRELPPLARVNQLFKDKGYGFLVTPEGREVYFHKDSVLNRAFDRLRVGATVLFAEEQGDKGPQASSVRIAPRRGMRQLAKQPAA